MFLSGLLFLIMTLEYIPCFEPWPVLAVLLIFDLAESRSHPLSCFYVPSILRWPIVWFKAKGTGIYVFIFWFLDMHVFAPPPIFLSFMLLNLPLTWLICGRGCSGITPLWKSFLPIILMFPPPDGYFVWDAYFLSETRPLNGEGCVAIWSWPLFGGLKF